MSEFDWLGIPPVSTPTTSTGKGKGSAKKSKRPLAKGKTLASTPSCSKNGDQDSAQNEPITLSPEIVRSYWVVIERM